MNMRKLVFGKYFVSPLLYVTVLYRCINYLFYSIHLFESKLYLLYYVYLVSLIYFLYLFVFTFSHCCVNLNRFGHRLCQSAISLGVPGQESTIKPKDFYFGISL